MTDDDELVGRLRRIREAVSAAGFDLDTQAGAAAIQALLSEASTSRPSGKPSIPDLDEESPATKVAAWAEVDVEELHDVLDFTDNGAELILWDRKLPKGKADRQRTLAALKLGADRIGFGVEEIDTRVIFALCDRYDCSDQNLAKNLQARNLVTRRGQRGSYVYRLTHDGVSQARQVMKELVQGTQEGR